MTSWHFEDGLETIKWDHGLSLLVSIDRDIYGFFSFLQNQEAKKPKNQFFVV